MKHTILCLLVLFWISLNVPCKQLARGAEIAGVTITPHVIAESMRYRRERDPALGAKVQLFIKGPSELPAKLSDSAELPSSLAAPTFNGMKPAQLLASDEWAWHDLDQATSIPEGALSVWTFNGKQSTWGIGSQFSIAADQLATQTVAVEEPAIWIEAVTFLADGPSIYPSTIVLHIANQSSQPLNTSSLRLWLPKDGGSWQVLWPGKSLDAQTTVAPGDRGFLKLTVPSPLPLTYAALELTTDQDSLWAHLRIKKETFDISGGWIGDFLRDEEYLKLLTRLHINAGQIQDVGGYTDNPELYAKYPMKLFNRMMPLEKWDSDQWLPHIHAVEFLGEPQFGGGRPVPPQEVFDAFVPYRSSRLATSVTHSDERTWRFYAGLSDFPHYDAYRVVAPSPDQWRSYDRWNGERITWGAPLESIGDMCRSLRDLNRPVPCAYWSQGPHHGWGSGLFGDGRKRRSPTPDELRSQAMHALATRITSLYWFNLSLKSLLKFPDTWDPIMRIGREIRMLEPFYLEGASYEFQRLPKPDGSPDWDLASIVAPDAAILFALDTAYYPDKTERVFTFAPPRDVTFRFRLPYWLQRPLDVFRVDADGIHKVEWIADESGVTITDQCSRDAIYVAAKDRVTREAIESRRQQAISIEDQHQIDLSALESLLSRK
ncbi:hypothetical protein SH449x_002516 [Pirellulaceae bacterium SH449]